MSRYSKSLDLNLFLNSCMSGKGMMMSMSSSHGIKPLWRMAHNNVPNAMEYLMLSALQKASISSSMLNWMFLISSCESLSPFFIKIQLYSVFRWEGEIDENGSTSISFDVEYVFYSLFDEVHGETSRYFQIRRVVCRFVHQCHVGFLLE